MRQIQINSLFAFLLLSLLNIAALAQIGGQGSTPAPLAKGRPIGSYQISDIENINYFSGHLTINVPVDNGKGRGEGAYPVVVNLNSPTWSTHREYVPDNTGNGGFVPADFAEYGFVGSISGIPGSVFTDYGAKIKMHYAYSDSNHCQEAPFYLNALTKISVTMPDGTEYEFRDTLTEGQLMSQIYCGYYRNRGRTFVTRDGTNLKFVADNDVLDNGLGTAIAGYLYMPNGTVARYNTLGQLDWIRDRNGNLTAFENATENNIAVRRIVDSIGRKTAIHGYYFDNDSPETAYIKFKGVGGADREVSVIGNTLGNTLASGESILSPYQAFYNTGGYSSGSPVISEIGLPNGQSYKFKYNSYGEIARMEMPAGAVVEYTWANGIEGAAGSGLISDGSTYIYRRVIERRLYADGVNLTAKTTIGRPEYLDGASYEDLGYVDVKTYIPGLASFERHYYYGKASDTFKDDTNYADYRPWTNGREYKTEILKPEDSSLLRRTTQQFEQTAPSWWDYACGALCHYGDPDQAPVNNALLTETTLTLETNQVSRQTFSYDGNLNRTDVYDYDFGSGAAGSFLRRTHTDFLTTNPANSNIDYTAGNNYLLNLPSQSWISSDSSGNDKVSLTKFEYDNYTTDTYHAGLTSRSNVFGFDSTNFASATVRGNVTAVTTYENASGTPSGEVRIYSQYDILGNAVKTFDGKGNATITSYGDNFGSPDNNATTNSAPGQLNGLNTFAFPTSTTNPLNWTAYSQFDYYTGAAVNTQDVNGLISKTIYNDPLDRPTQSVSAIGTSNEIQTTVAYDDTNRKVQTTGDLNTLNDNLLKKISLYDKLGRTTETRSYEADGDYVAVQTKFDPLGRAYRQSNPFRPTETPENNILWATTSFDALSRVTELETPDCAAITNCEKPKTAYNGNRTLVTDQTGKQRINKTDAIGRLTDVWEITPSDAATVSVSFPNHSLSSGYQTSYQYDVLGNLTGVTQSIPNQVTQTRSFVYDSLSRLKQATNPESGTVKYTYDANRNLQTKWNDRHIKTIYEYDVLNRATKRCYKIVTSSLGATNCAAAGSETPEPNTSDVSYTYENTNITNLKGVLTKTTNGFSTTENTQFDAVGKITKSKQTTDGTAYNEMEYTSNLSGALIEETYPSGRKVKNTMDNAGQLLQVQSKKNSSAGYWTYANSFTVTAAGAVSSMQLGNGHWESTSFNDRLQPIQIALGNTSGAANLLNISYTYGQWESGTLHQEKNNGNIAQQVIRIPTVSSHIDFTQKYEYDALNRLKNAAETESATSTQTWRQAFTYDRYGNRSFDETNTTTLTKSCGSSPNFTVCAADRKVENPSFTLSTNRIVLDQDGDSVNDYTFDAAGNTTRDATSQEYVYDGENRMLQAVNGSNTLGTYFYDGDGRRVKKVAYENGNPIETTIFIYNATGKLVSEYSSELSPAPEVGYLTSDVLGSPRINTNANGTVMSRHDYHPFGEEISTPQRIANGYSSDEIRKKFTGYERDDETGLDFAQARYFSSGFGRFSSPDDFLNATRPQDPASWNLYTYVHNNPLRLIDPSGQVEIDPLTGKVRFDPSKEKPETYIASKIKIKDDKGNEVKIGGKTAYATASWTKQKGELTANDGKTKIEAFKNSAVEFKITDSKGNELTGAPEVATNALNELKDNYAKLGVDTTADCHGTSFAAGQIWINDNQVEKLKTGDGYRVISKKEAQAGDIGVYREASVDEQGQTQYNVVHSVILNADGTARSKSGFGPLKENAPLGPGPNTAWSKNASSVKIEYWTLRPKQKN